ncbi:MAG TPA: hypothetical protein VMB49_19135 [Acidobacteriaceae bacterium]|nr:hypothetical protein [Acidobacteriaceae bacterium]
MNFEGVEKVAAAVLYEGYILYPYRPTAIKNRQRWNFGTLYPRVYAQAQRPQEPFRMVAECLAVIDGEATLDVRLRFLQLIRQRGGMTELTDPSLAWDEAVERTVEQSNLAINDLLTSPLWLRVPLDQLQIELTIAARMLDERACKLRFEVENATPLASGAQAKREEALPLSFVSAHLLLGIHGAKFISLLDPPEEYRAAVAGCSNEGVFPVLAGEEPDRGILFCSPIILYDYPKIAPESDGDFFDGTEMDEMLTLRVLTMTDAEKQEMLKVDPRARRILERTEALTGEAMLKTHGVIRDLREIRGDES